MSARILLVEDNERNRYLQTYLLERAGHEVIQASDGAEGLRSAAQHPPDLVLLDIQLPGMNGYEIATRLRQRVATARVPIVAVTAHAQSGDRDRILAAGFTHYIEKPIDPARFVKEVEQCLTRDVKPTPR